MLSRLRQLRAFGPARRALLIEAIWRLALARAMLSLRPFRAIAAPWGAMVPASDPRCGAGLLPADGNAAETARAVRWAVSMAARNLFFKPVCLPQAMAARAMLVRRGVPAVVHFGAGHDDGGKFEAHAWLDAAGVRVTGYPVAAHFAEIGAFVPR